MLLAGALSALGMLPLWRGSLISADRHHGAADPVQSIWGAQIKRLKVGTS
jgi:hypothetical protein